MKSTLGILSSAIVTVFVAASSATFASAAELVDNPMYLAWSEYKPGATATFQGTLELASLAGEAPTRVNQQVIYTLVNLSADQAIVQSSTSVNSNGKWLTYPPELLKISAKTEKGTEGVLSVDDGQPNVKRTLTEIHVSNQKIDLFPNSQNPKTVDAIIREYTINLITDRVDGTIAMRSKGWYVADIPGGLVRVESVGISALQTTTKLELTDYTPRAPNNLPATLPARAAASRPGDANPFGSDTIPPPAPPAATPGQGPSPAVPAPQPANP